MSEIHGRKKREENDGPLQFFSRFVRLIDRSEEIPESSYRRKEMKQVEHLVKRAKRGDAEAFIELIEGNKQSMYKVARGFLREKEDVADAMAETVLNCFEKIGSLKQDSYFKTWMIRILINNCKDMLQSRNRNIPVEEIPEQAEKASGGVLEFREMIEPLKEQDRSIFTLYYVYGMKAREIADCMEMKESTVVTRLKRGREALRSEMTESLEKGGRR